MPDIYTIPTRCALAGDVYNRAFLVVKVEFCSKKFAKFHFGHPQHPLHRVNGPPSGLKFTHT